MTLLDELAYALQETTVARRVGTIHDKAREDYQCGVDRVSDWDSFKNVIADYYTYHFARCVAHGGRLSRAEAWGKAKEIIEREYHRRRSDIHGAFADARDGTNGGVRVLLNTVAEGIKATSSEYYMIDEIDSRIPPNDFTRKTQVVREVMDRLGVRLENSIQANMPQQYAQSYLDIIHTYVLWLQQTSSIFRRL